MQAGVKKYLSEIGRRGGKKSRRKLLSMDASLMVRIREAKRAYSQFYASCFWSFDPNYKITSKDIAWVAEQLMKNGNRAAWEVGTKLAAH